MTPHQRIPARILRRPGWGRLQLRLSFQTVEHFAYRDQTIFNFDWEMGDYQSIGGRVVQSNDRWNWLASYRMSGNVGTESS